MSKDLIFKATKRNWSRGSVVNLATPGFPVRTTAPTPATRSRALKLKALHKEANYWNEQYLKKHPDGLLHAKVNGGRCDALDGVPFVGDEERSLIESGDIERRTDGRYSRIGDRQSDRLALTIATAPLYAAEAAILQKTFSESSPRTPPSPSSSYSSSRSNTSFSDAIDESIARDRLNSLRHKMEEQQAKDDERLRQERARQIKRDHKLPTNQKVSTDLL